MLPPKSHHAVKMPMIRATHIKEFQDVSLTLLENTTKSVSDGCVVCPDPAYMTLISRKACKYYGICEKDGKFFQPLLLNSSVY